ncbi:uncharacterized protein LOC134067904 isoform X2 [Sardina pilchardus]|uniref:uncharacterized protein LOC134067904 isoform X2 n=1 Tax=Sardina pilchardus TaxID=27697 RepID=UPI002E112ADA
MKFCWFLACCLPARQDEDKKIKRHVKKYGLVELKRELESLRVNMDEAKKANKKTTKKNLQKLLIKELKKKIERSKNGLDNGTYEDELPEHVLAALNELETLRVNTDDDEEEIKKKCKRKSELQRFLINEAKEVDHDKKELYNKVSEEEGTMPMDEVLNVLDDLDTFLDKELEVASEGETRRKRQRER